MNLHRGAHSGLTLEYGNRFGDSPLDDRGEDAASGSGVVRHEQRLDEGGASLVHWACPWMFIGKDGADVPIGWCRKHSIWP